MPTLSLLLEHTQPAGSAGISEGHAATAVYGISFPSWVSGIDPPSGRCSQRTLCPKLLALGIPTSIKDRAAVNESLSLKFCRILKLEQVCVCFQTSWGLETPTKSSRDICLGGKKGSRA